ncbi:hypothetical protein KBJ98_02115 [Flavobacterium sp. F-328]|uniref:Uncharacterized protein n=1 Tax=Flavobacterium erciyesense TaxID=2825842 RepID=A0ABS5D0D7_9FLAO|nr:hypothetical protein [Flavobacterium erciyesense]MBQ0907491.1 hypothetical protein [Flavobacterium erciyesense]
MKINIVIPASWNELSDSQFKELAKLSYSGKTGNYFDLQCFKILLNIRWYQFSRRMHVKFVLSQISIKTLKKTFDFVYKANDRTIFPKISNGYFPPLDKITNLTAEEFSVADDLHIKWRTTQDKEYLIYLAAVLYSKKKQPREPFDKNNLPDKIKHFKKLPIAVLLCIELAYFGCKNHLVKRFPKAFPKGTKKVSNSKYGFGKVILQMAGGKFGNHEQTKSTNIYTFLEEFTENLNSAKNG